MWPLFRRMDYAKFQGLRLYVEFDEQAAQLLRQLRPLLTEHIPAIIDDFYLAINRYPSARSAIRGGEAQVERLKKSLTQWLYRVLSGIYDEQYVETHSRIGRKHVEIRLPQELMFVAMNRIRVGLLQTIETVVPKQKRMKACLALNQVLDLELGLMLDTYREASDRRIRMEVERSSVQEKLRLRYEELSERLENSGRRTRAIIDGLPAFVAAVDDAGCISFWNRQLEQVTGFTSSEMIGTPSEGVLDTTESVRLALKGGGHRLARWQRTQVKFDNGPPVTYALGIDVTEEAEMQRRATRAERLAAVGTLATGLAHEVRNPLNSASLQLQTLRRRLRKGAGLKGIEPIVERVEDEIGRLDALVGDFLAFARPRALTLTYVNFNGLLQELSELLRPELQASGVQLVLDLDPLVGDVNVDEGQIRQVVHNLVRNAAQALGQKGTVTICTRAANSRAQITLEVVDTGPGFNAEAPIFDAFFTTKASGTGLGLAIVHRIIQEHGGSIAAESQPGNTRFCIRLPQPTRN